MSMIWRETGLDNYLTDQLKVPLHFSSLVQTYQNIVHIQYINYVLELVVPG